ncbi:SCF ubiquitin ligase complex subunit cdc4, partial [Lunasporangiospora selenospora]
LEDALFKLSASAHQRALRSASSRSSRQTVGRHLDQNEQETTQEIVSGTDPDGSTTTTIIRKSIEAPQRSLGLNHPWSSRAKKRPASPITPVGSVDVSMPQSSALGHSAMSSSNANGSSAAIAARVAARNELHASVTSFLDRSAPPHKKSKRPWTNSPLQQQGQNHASDVRLAHSGSGSKKIPSSLSAPSFTDFATPAVPHRSRIVEQSREQNIHTAQLAAGFIDPSSLPSPSLSPTATTQNSTTRRRFRTAPTSFHSGHHDPEELVQDEQADEEVYMSEPEEEMEGQEQHQEDMDVERSLQPTSASHIPTLLDLPTLVSTFDALPSTLQSYMLFHLLRRTPAPTLQFVSNVILATMKTDFLSLLPVELGRNILRFLDGRSLCKAAQVSKQWRVVVDSDAHIWMNLIQKEGFVLDENEEDEAYTQRLGIDGHYGVRPSYQTRKLLAKKRAAKGKGRPNPAIVRPQDLPESPLYPNDVTMLGDDETEMPEDGESKEEAFMTPDAAPPSPTTSHTGRFNDAESEDEAMDQDPMEESFGSMSPSTSHPFKALFRRHWIIRQNWAKGRAKYIKFTGHSNHVVTCLQFDSEKIISGSDDQCIHVYDTTTGSRLKKLDGHEGGVWALQYRGNTLVSGSTDRTVRVWDIEKGVCTHIFRGHTSTVRCLQIVMPVNVNKDPNGPPKYEPEFPVIVTGSRDSTLLVWRMPDPELNSHIPANDSSWLMHTLVGHTQSVRALAAEGSTLVSGSYDCTVRVWNLCTGAIVHRLQGHTQKVYSVVLDTERNQCMSGSMDATVRIWSLEDGSCLHVLDGHTSLVGLLGLNANHLVSAAADFTVRIWDPARGVCLRLLAAHAAAITCFQHDANKTGKFVRNLLTGLGSVWQVKFDERRCVAAVQRNGVNGGNGATYFEVLDYGVYGIEEPFENAPSLPVEESVDVGAAGAAPRTAAAAAAAAAPAGGAHVPPVVVPVVAVAPPPAQGGNHAATAGPGAGAGAGTTGPGAGSGAAASSATTPAPTAASATAGSAGSASSAGATTATDAPGPTNGGSAAG